MEWKVLEETEFVETYVESEIILITIKTYNALDKVQWRNCSSTIWRIVHDLCWFFLMFSMDGESFHKYYEALFEYCQKEH